MNSTLVRDPQGRRKEGRRMQIWPLRRVLALAGAIVLGLLSVALVLALDSYQTFHTSGEQITLGTGVSGSHTDTAAADDTYRVLQEEYVGGAARTSGDNPASASYQYTATYTGVMNFTPYVMPSEGGLIHELAIYIFKAGNTQFRLALYEDLGGVPRFLLAQSEPLTATSVGWLQFDIDPQLVLGNTRYWLGYQATNSDAALRWKDAPIADGYRYRSQSWGSFPTLLGTTSGPVARRTCYQIGYTATHNALDVTYTVPVTPMLDVYTLTVQGATSGESFAVTADGQSVGSITYSPSTQTVYSDDMEGGTGAWTAAGFTRIVTDSTHYWSPTHAWWTDDVPTTSTASLTSTAVALPFNARNMELRFWHRVISERGYDGGWVEYRIQNANGSWPGWSTLNATMFLQGGYNAVLYSIPSGQHSAWSGEYGYEISNTVRIRIPAAAAGRSIQWRWVFECDKGQEASTQPNGWWIDDVRVLADTSPDTNLALSLTPSLANDGQIAVRFQDTITDSYADVLGIDLIEVTGLLYNRAPSVTVTAPNGGEYWRGTRTVQWTGSDRNQDVITYNVYVSTNNGGSWSASLYEVSYSETETPAAHSWSGFDTTAVADSGTCLVRVVASDGDASDSDESDAVFTIDNTDPSVSLTTPSGGEVVEGGASFEITWSASDANFGSNPIALYYSTNGGTTFPYVITSGTPNNGSFDWAVPTIDDTDVRVRVVATDLAGNTNDDESTNFAVDSTDPSVSLTAPGGGEVLQGGASFEITWSASDANFGSNPIALYYSTNGGTTFPYVITSGTPNGGSFDWTVPSINDTDVQVRVVATDAVGHTASDDSGDFTVDSTDPSVTLTAPSGGEALQGGASFEITWSASDPTYGFDANPIALYYSTNGGTTFPHVITGGTANDGSFDWTVPSINEPDVQVRAVATDAAGNTAADESGNFEIDSSAPDGTVSIDEGDYTASRDVQLTLSAPGDTVQMYIDGDVADASNVRQWIAYSTSAAVTLTVGEGSKTVTVRYRDHVGNEGSLANDSTVYDATPPTIADETPAEGATVLTGSPVISATLSDANSGIDSATITMTVDGALVTHAYDAGSGVVSYTPSPALTNASHAVALYSEDRAGNSVLREWSFSVDEPPESMLLTADPTLLIANGVYTSTISAAVQSLSGHPIADGTEVVFTTTLGTLPGGTVYTTTTVSGVATALLTAPEVEGIAVITARAGSVEEDVEVEFVRFWTYLPLVVKNH
jgi:hypothetical protein